MSVHSLIFPFYGFRLLQGFSFFLISRLSAVEQLEVAEENRKKYACSRSCLKITKQKMKKYQMSFQYSISDIPIDLSTLNMYYMLSGINRCIRKKP